MGKKKSSDRSTPRTPTGRGAGHKTGAGSERESPTPLSHRPVCATCGQVHPGCNGHTKHGPNAGKPCGMKPRTGQVQCIKHGGNHPAQIKKGRERLLELVDPALAALHRVLTDDRVEDSVKVRAALGILDRTGHGPRAQLEIGSSRWDELAKSLGDSGVVQLDRSTIAGELTVGVGVAGHPWESVAQHQADLTRENFAEQDSEDERPYATRMDSTGAIRGTVVGRYDVRADRAPTDPPRYFPDDA